MIKRLHPLFKIAYAPIIERFSRPACAGCRGRQPLRRRACALRIRRGAARGFGFVLRGRFVKRPYIRFSKLRIRRQASAFQVRHARVVEDADPYDGR